MKEPAYRRGRDGYTEPFTALEKFFPPRLYSGDSGQCIEEVGPHRTAEDLEQRIRESS